MGTKRVAAFVLLTMVYSEISRQRRELVSSFCEIDFQPHYITRECFKDEYAVICRNLNLTSVPETLPTPTNITLNKLCLLDLSVNSITELNEFSFKDLVGLKWLNLSNNQIRSVGKHTFKYQSNLLFLNLTSNNLTNTSFPPDVFKPLTNLKYISLKHNLLSSYEDMDGQFRWLTNLNSICLDLFQDSKFGENIAKLDKLTLASFSGIHTMEGVTCNISNITDSTLAAFTHVNTLYMSACMITSFSRNALSPLKNLTYLDISYNEQLEFKGMNDALCGIANSTSLKTLNVNQIHRAAGIGTAFESPHTECLRTLQNLTFLHMDLNKIEVFDKDIFTNNSFPPSLQVLTLAGNRLVYDDYIKDIYRLKGLSMLDISRQHFNYDPFYYEHFEPTELKGLHNLTGQYTSNYTDCKKECMDSTRKLDTSPLVLCIPDGVKNISLSRSIMNFNLPQFIVCGSESTSSIDFSLNIISSWVGPIHGLERLTHLNLSHNYCSTIKTTTFFQSFPALESLDISHNELRCVFKNGSHAKMFEKQSELKVLNMSNNELETLPVDLFKPLVSLEILNLRSNLIEDFNIHVDNCTHLHTIDVSCNKIDAISSSQMDSIDRLARTKKFTLKLASNPLQCDCDSIHFLEWMYSKKDASSFHIDFLPETQCRLSNGKKVQIADIATLGPIIDNVRVHCTQPQLQNLIIVAAAVSGSVITAVCCLFLYRNRWKIRYVYYSRRFKRHNHQGYERLFEFDAVVLYAKSDARFIKNTLVPALELSYGLKLWISDRNSCPGAYIPENIAFGMANSKKAVFLISKRYIADTWSDYEINMAHMEAVESKRQMLILVIMDKLDATKLPVTVMRHMKSETCLEFPQHPQDLETFWRSLAENIRSS